MPLLTLTTDWGTRDHFVGSLKGILYTTMPNIVLVDISHQVSRHNIQQAAFIFKNTYNKFPLGTVHFIGVNSHKGKISELLAIKKDGYYFIGMNDGLFSLIFDEVPVDMVVVSTVDQANPGYDLETVAHACNHLLEGNNVYELGPRPAIFDLKSSFRPVIEEEVIRGVVIYIDDFGNVVTNINRKLFFEQQKDRKFEIITRKLLHSLNVISEQYNHVVPGDIVAVFNASGYLEIAINQGSASKLLGLKHNDNIRIEFK